MFVRYLFIFTIPVFQFMMVVWRVQLKIRMPLGGTALLCFFLSMLTVGMAASVYPGSLARCIACGMDAGKTKGLYVFIGGIFVNYLLNLIFTLLGILEYRAALRRANAREYQQ